LGNIFKQSGGLPHFVEKSTYQNFQYHKSKFKPYSCIYLPLLLKVAAERAGHIKIQIIVFCKLHIAA